MEDQKNMIKIGIIVPLAGLFLCACSIENKLKWLDDRSGEVLEIIENEDFSDAATGTPFLEENNSDESGSVQSGELTRDVKLKIDEWLKKNGLNRYGDPVGTNYEGGTPLINEETGESFERFEYVMKKIPDILNRINE